MSVLTKVSNIPLLPFWIGLLIFIVAEVVFYSVAFDLPDDSLPTQGQAGQVESQ